MKLNVFYDNKLCTWITGALSYIWVILATFHDIIIFGGFGDVPWSYDDCDA